MITLFSSIQRFLIKTSKTPRNGTHVNLGKCRGTLTILYDNNRYDSRLSTAWGFSCLIRLNDASILFDAGGNGRLLVENVNKLGVDLSDIQFIVLSHIHADHTGGLGAILGKNKSISVFLPSSFPASLKNGIKGKGVNVVDVQHALNICECAATTGVLGTGIEEQSLIVGTEEGLVVVTGCAHPGILNIVIKAKELTGNEVYLVIGGFHLASYSEKQLAQIVSEMKELGVRKVAPCHCTGETARRLFKESFGADYIEVGVGKSLQIP